MACLRKALALLWILCGTAVSQGSVLLVGGGSEDYNDWSDAPYRWLVTHAPNRMLLVLHYADTTSFFSGYFPWLSPCTVENMAISSSAQANDSSVYRRILQHDGIFLRGGDQWEYVSKWRGTLTEQAIREVFQRGGVVGGSSAGEVILSDVVYDAHYGSASPRSSLRSPLGTNITLTDDFLSLVPNAVTDSHFFERGRLGRLPVFLGLFRQSAGRELVGIGVDYNTALAIGPDRIGEVMGSGTVTLLRYSPGTQFALEPGKPFSMSNILFDQLTVGARFNLSTGEIQPPAVATPYAAQLFSAPEGMVILDGSNSSSDWLSSSGSLKKLQAALNDPTDTIGIIASLATPAPANAVSSGLAAWGVASRILWISEAKNNDPAFAGEISSCGGYVFVGNAADSLARFLDTARLAGSAFFEQVEAGKPLAFLADDAHLAGDKGIGQMYRSIYGAYYGYLTQVDGLGILRGVQCVSRLYEQSDYIDNRASSVFWSMAKSHLPYGLLMDAGTHVTISGNRLQVYGSTPVMLIDGRAAVWASFPEWRDPGKLNARQNGGILGARMHVIRDGEGLDLGGTSDVSRRGGERELPDCYSLLQNYPNPSNPSTTVQYELPHASRVSLKVYNTLGQEIATLVNDTKPAGVYTVQFDAAGLASGVYFYRIQAGNFIQTRKMLVLR